MTGKNAHQKIIGINTYREGFEPNTIFMSHVEDWGYEAMLSGQTSKRRILWKNWYLVEDGFVVKTIAGLKMDRVSLEFLIDFFHNKPETDVED